PLREELPTAEPIVDSLRTQYMEHIEPLRTQLDCIEFMEPAPEPEETLITYNQ
ncbi:MAG: M23 family peptidase, partial [Flavobacteriia bacterium]